MNFLTLVTVFALAQGLQAVNWMGNWALKCDFPGNDLKSVHAQGEQCGSLCVNTGGCTHWSFTNHNGGTCWLKQGAVSKQNAFDSSDWSSSCGILEETTGPVTNKPVTDKPIVSDGSALSKLTGCRFSYGRDWVGENVDYSPYDYITIWIDTIRENCSGPQCTDFNDYYQGVMLRKCKELKKIPVFYGYVIAFEARNNWGLEDCNMGTPNLCQRGSKYIRENRARIIERYDHHSKAFANIIGRDAFCVFLMEPDFWQFYGNRDQEGGTLSGQDMRSLFDDMVSAIKKNLPNAAISWDISAWIKEQGQREWWDFFKSSPYIDFIHTSGGEGHGESSEFKPGENRWSFLSQSTGKKIIADAGYGVGGAGLDNRWPWYETYNVDNRARDGVCSVTLAGSNRTPTYRPNIC